MKTGNDTYIQWKQELYDQDVIKSYSYICHTPTRKIPRLITSPTFLQNPPLLGIPLLFSNFSIFLFLGIFGKVIPPQKGRGRFKYILLCSALVFIFKDLSIAIKENGNTYSQKHPVFFVLVFKETYKALQAIIKKKLQHTVNISKFMAPGPLGHYAF